MKKFIILLVLILIAGAAYSLYNNGSFVSKQSDLSQKYSDPNGAFSFNYPEGLSITQSNDEENQISRTTAESKESKNGFEVIISPFDEQGPLTEERIRADLPDIVMENISKITVAGSIPALAFNSIDEGFGRTYEIWFVNKGSLFQIMSYPEFKFEMDKIIKTWKAN